jgi:hypothetical protein
VFLFRFGIGVVVNWCYKIKGKINTVPYSHQPPSHVSKFQALPWTFIVPPVTALVLTPIIASLMFYLFGAVKLMKPLLSPAIVSLVLEPRIKQ